MMWGTDGTKFWTEEDGWCWLFPVIDHHDREIMGHRTAKDGKQHEWLWMPWRWQQLIGSVDYPWH